MVLHFRPNYVIFKDTCHFSERRGVTILTGGRVTNFLALFSTQIYNIIFAYLALFKKKTIIKKIAFRGGL